VLVLAWAALVAATELLDRRSGQSTMLCHLRRLTGVPCPTCGGTRAVFALIDGRPLAALAHNPLVIVAGAGFCLWLGLRLACGRRLELRLSARERWSLPWLVGLAVAANWCYVLAHEAGR
jgi:hypothetical protein